MAYSVESISSVTDCESLLEDNEREIKRIEFELTSLGHKQEEQQFKSIDLQEDIQLAEAKVIRLQGELDALIEGSTAHTTKALELESADLRVRVLQNRVLNGNRLSLVEQAKDLALAEATLVVEQELKSALEGRKTELESAS